jgi:hypothetical protein
MTSKAPSNTNGPIVILHPNGKGALLYRALARVLVRQLIAEDAIPANTDCESMKAG